MALKSKELLVVGESKRPVPIQNSKFLKSSHAKLTGEWWEEGHVSKLKATDRAAIFNEMMVRKS